MTCFKAMNCNTSSGSCQIDDKVYPMVGFGTYPLTGEICFRSIEEALKSGYRIIDTATRYKNFEAIAQALKGKNREEIYLISKVWHDSLQYEGISSDLKSTLKQLQVDYLDAYLIHWPNSQISIEETLGAMEELRQSHKVRHLGLSNVSVNHLKRALETKVQINWVQVEMHPFFCDFELLKFCQEQCIAVQAWSPLGRGLICQEPLLIEVGRKYDKTPAQVAIRWIIQHKAFPLPSSQNPKHIAENIKVDDFWLSDEEMQKIDARAKLGSRKRFVKDKIGFSDEFDYSYEECWPKVKSRL